MVVSEVGCWTGTEVILLLSRNHRLPLGLYLPLVRVQQPLNILNLFFVCVLHREVIRQHTTIWQSVQIFKWWRSCKRMGSSDSWKKLLVMSLWQGISCYLKCVVSRRTQYSLSSKMSVWTDSLWFFYRILLKLLKAWEKNYYETIMAFQTFSGVIPVFQLLEKESRSFPESL